MIVRFNEKNFNSEIDTKFVETSSKLNELLA